MQYYPGTEWYAIRVRYRHEHVVEKGLGNKRLSPLHLTYRELSKRKSRREVLTKPFFPGYMFIKTKLDAAQHVEVLKTFGVVEIIKNSEGPVPIPESQIRNVQKLEKYSGKILTLATFATGMMVRVIHGPLQGLLGRIDEMHKKYVKLSIDSIPGSIAIQIPYVDLEPIDRRDSLASLF